MNDEEIVESLRPRTGHVEVIPGVHDDPSWSPDSAARFGYGDDVRFLMDGLGVATIEELNLLVRRGRAREENDGTSR